ncbi:uncharacterized protein VTP21DRAFT_4409 [Calcarisporiella thermophila]|uniref:uncharacterized protein n=1 Tax=Calcarisporiella thermophila TaxID=911321 RepID=UPI00374443F1
MCGTRLDHNTRRPLKNPVGKPFQPPEYKLRKQTVLHHQRRMSSASLPTGAHAPKRASMKQDMFPIAQFLSSIEPPVRESLVLRAVTFLKTPLVNNAPYVRKVAFLERKGLTSREIELALKQVMIEMPSETPLEYTPPPAVPARTYSLAERRLHPFPQRAIITSSSIPQISSIRPWKRFVLTLLLTGTLFATVIRLMKKLVLPYMYLFTRRCNSLSKLRALLPTLPKLSNTILQPVMKSSLCAETPREDVRPASNLNDKIPSPIKQQKPSPISFLQHLPIFGGKNGFSFVTSAVEALDQAAFDTCLYPGAFRALTIK